MPTYLSMTPVPDSQGQQSSTSASELDAPHDFVLGTYGSVWAEHASHHVEHCRNSFISLKRSHPRRRRPPPRSTLFADHSLSRAMAASTSSVDPHPEPLQFESFAIYEYDTANETSLPRLRETKALVLTASPPFPPYPSYNSCAPISRSIMVGDDSEELPFIQFADDPTYDYHLDIENHGYFAWPNLTQDPDSNYLCELNVFILISLR